MQTRGEKIIRHSRKKEDAIEVGEGDLSRKRRDVPRWEKQKEKVRGGKEL